MMNSNQLREKAIDLIGRALDDLNKEKVLDDSSLDILVECIDTILDLILANGFELPVDVQGFIRGGEPLTPLEISGVSGSLDCAVLF